MNDDLQQPSLLGRMVSDSAEFDRFVSDALPALLDRATMQTKRFLRETNQWADDTMHEKLALRWGYELVERFVVCGRTEVPCRPFFLLDSLIAKYYSQPDPLCYHRDLLSPVGRFLDGLTARAVVSRDALMALFYHLYGLNQTQVAKVLGLGMAESQRVYKNFERWRQSGWQRTMADMGLTEGDLESLEELQRKSPDGLNGEADRLVRLLQSHYRKSEPEHYPCLTRERWGELFRQDYAYDYRMWHLPLCVDCFSDVYTLRCDGMRGAAKPRIDLHVRPLQRRGVMAVFAGTRGGGKGHGTRQPVEPVSQTSA